MYADFSAGRCKFHRIAKQINQHLAYPHTVRQKPFMVHPDILYKVNPLCLRLRRNQLPYSIQHFIDIKIARLQLHLTAFNFGHIQNIVDEVQQVIAGGMIFFRYSSTCAFSSI